MSRTFTNLLSHLIFSTKERQPFIDPNLRPELYAYLGGLTKELKAKAYGINGDYDQRPHAGELASSCFHLRGVTVYQIQLLGLDA